MPRSKFNAQKVRQDGYIFDSKAENRRYNELKLLHQAGAIHKLVIHPRYTLLDPFEVKGIRYRSIVYEGDFEYIENGKRICEDVKGYRTAVFGMKEKLFLNRYGDEIELRVTEA
jgi:hypothetical protein